ncbi:MAG: hypothetical protein A2847_02285 [Candidatus Sungbacteria bacterium RIFCSPHIGHO2_01_FULL_50_25]|uniref:Uncharacterized protein n=1 Tax=Candidatus Sungbacteria bacterium RIFCSPHIGHO2_01_FULL_50_25 TaxID=1802265 RepID=A0A1G2KAG7_9BACT|nr:MAG: hypothetical protein A2847_02285 [Candidatus Sungbacteria bacterium RIFCSPHIGHO2_01_FULL_50_25]
MITTKSLTKEISELRGLGELVSTYEFIAASAMRRIRNTVLENRAFHLGLNDVYQEVKRAYEADLRMLVGRRGEQVRKESILMRKSKKTALVFLSANTALYGDIIAKTFSLFIREAAHGGADIVVIGKVGRALLERELLGKKYIYFDFPDTAIAQENLKTISKHLSQYEKVIVFHGRFKSLVSQEAAASSVSGDELEAIGRSDGAEGIKYIFEPSLETIVIFFETEIFGSLLEQVFHESRLAKLASRMILLDRASVNVGGVLKRMTFRRGQLEHRAFNRKQLDALSGIGLWTPSSS